MINNLKSKIFAIKFSSLFTTLVIVVLIVFLKKEKEKNNINVLLKCGQTCYYAIIMEIYIYKDNTTTGVTTKPVEMPN